MHTNVVQSVRELTDATHQRFAEAEVSDFALIEWLAVPERDSCLAQNIISTTSIHSTCNTGMCLTAFENVFITFMWEYDTCDQNTLPQNAPGRSYRTLKKSTARVPSFYPHMMTLPSGALPLGNADLLGV